MLQKRNRGVSLGVLRASGQLALAPEHRIVSLASRRLSIGGSHQDRHTGAHAGDPHQSQADGGEDDEEALWWWRVQHVWVEQSDVRSNPVVSRE